MVAGDKMKLKRWYLYIIATLCFVICFVSINKKYDPFYRVNGINNDNRALIQQYLDQSEQQYLIDNAISMNAFTKYIASPNFYLPYYEFYTALDRTKIFKSIDALVDNTNTIVTRLTTSHGKLALRHCKQLISYNLVLAFLNQDSFLVENIPYYQQVRTLYDDVDYSYVQATNEYITLLQSYGFIEEDALFDTVSVICDNYDKESIHTLLTTVLPPEVQRVYNPSEWGLILDDSTFIGTYEPKNLVITEKIPRDYYSKYLQKDAYLALKEMYDVINQECTGYFLLTAGYNSYKSLSLQGEEGRAGYHEEQLGTTIHVQKQGYLKEEFVNTDIYQWLQENSYKYAYILRYPAGKEEITKHPFSSNIYRYVGKDIAKEIYENNSSLEEYQASKK